MDIVYGNLIEVVESGRLGQREHLVVLQNCNCQCRMGAGLARDIARHWPEAELADRDTRRGDQNKLGHWSMAVIEREDIPPFTVHNLYCQYRYGPAYERHFDPLALEHCCERLADYYAGQNVRFVFGLLGTGHAGGRWRVIREILERHLGHHPMTLVKLPPSTE